MFFLPCISLHLAAIMCIVVVIIFFLSFSNYGSATRMFWLFTFNLFFFLFYFYIYQYFPKYSTQTWLFFCIFTVSFRVKAIRTSQFVHLFILNGILNQ